MAKKETSRGPEGSDNPFAPLLQLQEAGLGNIMGANAAWLESIGDMGAEVASFMAERIKEDVKTQHAIMHCKDVAEVQNIQTSFMRKAVEQYQAETGKLVQMGMTAFKTDDETSS